MDEPAAVYRLWWEHGDWRVVAHEPLWPIAPGIPAISVQFDTWKPRRRANPQPPALDIPLGQFDQCDKELEPTGVGP
jgi:hypothetical protein